MTLIRRVARPMLASMFVMGGYSALRNPQAHVQMAGPVTEKLSEATGQATSGPTTSGPTTSGPTTSGPTTSGPTSSLSEKQLVQINGAAQLIGGLALATGRFPRLASLVLAGSLVPTTYAGHRFWEETDKTQRANQQIHFFKNVSMLGGLLIAGVDTEGKPGVAWRASHAVGSAKRGGKQLRRAARTQAKLASKSVKS